MLPFRPTNICSSFEIRYVLCTHSAPITRLLTVQPIKMPPDQGNRYSNLQNSFMSVGMDRSVGIYSLDTFAWYKQIYNNFSLLKSKLVLWTSCADKRNLLECLSRLPSYHKH